MIQKLCGEDFIDIAGIRPYLDTLITEERQKELSLPPTDQQQRAPIHEFLTGFFDKYDLPFLVNSNSASLSDSHQNTINAL